MKLTLAGVNYSWFFKCFRINRLKYLSYYAFRGRYEHIIWHMFEASVIKGKLFILVNVDLLQQGSKLFHKITKTSSVRKLPVLYLPVTVHFSVQCICCAIKSSGALTTSFCWIAHLSFYKA